MPLHERYSVRPARRDDAGEITEMFIEQETLMNGEGESTVEDLYDDWSAPGFDIARDTWTVWEGGKLVGYAGIVKSIPPDIYAAYGGVRPSHWGNGIGTHLFESVEGRTLELGGGAAWIRQWVDAGDKVAISILEGRGYSFVRRFWRMDVALDEALVEAGPVENVTIRAFQPGDERIAHEVLEEAFAEHWGFTPRTYEQSAVGRWEADWFRRDLSLVAEAEGRMVAVCVNGARFRDGFVEDLGVLPGWRGRGIAEALLRRSFAMFRDLGMDRASLNVDSDNSTGAMRLYERVGMRPSYSYDVYHRRLGG